MTPDESVINGDVVQDISAIKDNTYWDAQSHDETEVNVPKSNGGTKNSVSKSISQERLEDLARHLVHNSNGHKIVDENEIATLKFVASRLAKRAEEARR